MPINVTGVSFLRLLGLAGDDTFNVPGDFPTTLGVAIQGGDPSASDTLNFTGTGGPIVVDLDAQTIKEGANPAVSISGVETVNVNAAGGALTVNGTTGDDDLTYTPSGPSAGSVALAGLNTVVNFSNVNTAPGSFVLDPLGGADSVTVKGTADDDTITALPSGANTSVQVNNLQTVALVNANTEALVVAGGLGNDTLSVNSNGSTNPVAIPITYDGGADFNAMILRGTATSDTYSPGPEVGSGSNTIVYAGGTEVVNFLNLSPIFDFIAGPLVVNGTNADNAINYKVGFNSLANYLANNPSTTWGEVSVDGFEPIEFINKTTLTINGKAGSDTINLNNPNTPTGLNSITVNGGDPTGSDTVIVNGRVNLADAIQYNPTSSDAGNVVITGLPTVNFTGAEHLQIDGQNDAAAGPADTLDIHTLNIDGNFVLTPGNQFDSGHVDFRDGGFLLATATPVTFDRLGVGGSLSFTDIGRFDNLIYRGTDVDDTFSVNATGQVSLNTQIVVNTQSIANLTLAGLDGDDTFNIAGNHNLNSIAVQGGDPSASDVLNFNGTGGAITADLAARTVTEVNPVSFTGVEVVNIAAAGAALNVNGTAVDDQITYRPSGLSAGTFQNENDNTVFNFTNVSRRLYHRRRHGRSGRHRSARRHEQLRRHHDRLAQPHRDRRERGRHGAQAGQPGGEY